MNKAQKITKGVTLIIMSCVSMVWDTWGRDGLVIRQALEFIKITLAVMFLGWGVFILLGLIKKKEERK